VETLVRPLERAVDAAVPRSLAQLVSGVDFRSRDFEDLVALEAPKCRETPLEQRLRVTEAGDVLPFGQLVLDALLRGLGRQIHDGVGIAEPQAAAREYLLVGRRPRTGARGLLRDHGPLDVL